MTVILIIFFVFVTRHVIGFKLLTSLRSDSRLTESRSESWTVEHCGMFRPTLDLVSSFVQALRDHPWHKTTQSEIVLFSKLT